MVNNDTYKQKLKKGLLINRINMIVDKHKSMVSEGFFEIAFPSLTRFAEESFVCQIMAP